MIDIKAMSLKLPSSVIRCLDCYAKPASIEIILIERLIKMTLLLIKANTNIVVDLSLAMYKVSHVMVGLLNEVWPNDCKVYVSQNEFLKSFDT
jgi:hypothetical protein